MATDIQTRAGAPDGMPYELFIYLVYDESKLVKTDFDIAVQVNGKVRATISINIDDTEEVIKEKALSAENVIKHTSGKEIVKVIVIKNKIVNIVVKG